MTDFQLNIDDFPGLAAPSPVNVQTTAPRNHRWKGNGQKQHTSTTPSDSNPDTDSNTPSDTPSDTQSDTHSVPQSNGKPNIKSEDQNPAKSATKPNNKPQEKSKAKSNSLFHNNRPSFKHGFLLRTSPSLSTQLMLEALLSNPEGDWAANFLRDDDDDDILEYSGAATTNTKPKTLGNSCRRLLPEVPKEMHNAGEPVFMSGAVSAKDKIKPILSEDDNIDCMSTKAPENMPYKVIRYNELLEMDLGLDDQSYLRQLPSDFVTTCLGLQKGVSEWVDSRFAYTNDPEFANFDWDQSLVEFIKYRGGFAPTLKQEVIYPEQILPFMQAERGPEGWRWNGSSQIYDEAYWLELQARGKVWDTMPHIPSFRRR